MDKSKLKEESLVKDAARGHVVLVLAAAVAVLGVAFLLLVVFASLLVHDLQQSNQGTTEHGKRVEKIDEFQVNSPSDSDIEHERVIMNEAEQTEFVTVYDHTTRYIKHIMMVDFRQGLQGIFFSSEQLCFFMQHLDADFRSFAEDLDFLREHNGQNVTHAPYNEYEAGPRVTNTSVIPDEMAPFCSLSNSYWLAPADSHGRVIRAPQHNHEGGGCCCCTHRCCCCIMIVIRF